MSVKGRSSYAYTLGGLLGGLLFLLFMPLPSPILNYVVGGALLALAVAAVTYLIVLGSAPDERGPDF